MRVASQCRSSRLPILKKTFASEGAIKRRVASVAYMRMKREDEKADA